MSYLTLMLGLGLPWLGGYAWLAFIESFSSPTRRHHHARHAGYGFFLGYAVLYFVILLDTTINERVSFSFVAAMLGAFSLSGLALLAWRVRRLPLRQPSPPQSQIFRDLSRSSRFLVWILLAWALLHLLLALAEVITQPLYPWDAWLVWVYRAKAWFYSGTVPELLSRSDWLISTSPVTYTIGAHDYPLFATLVPFWAALSLGEWSETLINIPVVLCGIALGLALYGQCREHGMHVLVSVVLVYLFFSVPILGTHLSLGGYADIWMAGYAGLGFIALIRGLAEQDRAQLGLGIIMLAFGMLVKFEGVAWFYAGALLILVTMVRARTLLIMLAGLVVIVILMAASGVTYVEIPGLGGLGVAGERFAIPFLGLYTFRVYNVWEEYLLSFFFLGSWHLTWLLVGAGLLAVLRVPKSRTRRAATSFLLVFVATQVLIFVFSDQGDWAASYTAINRLPLQFLPALLFASAAILNTLVTKKSTTEGAVAEIEGARRV